MKLTVLAGGLGGARLVRALRQRMGLEDQLCVVANTSSDATVYGLRFCPDVDGLSAALDPVGHGWPGQVPGDSPVRRHLLALGASPSWFPVSDAGLAAAVLRSQWLGQAMSLSEATQQMARSLNIGARLLPMSDEPIETHVVVDTGRSDVAPDSLATAAAGREQAEIDPGEARSSLQAVHVQEWAHHLHPQSPLRFSAVGLDRARPAPETLDAIRGADAVVLAPGCPVRTFGTMLALPGMRDALRGTSAPVLGIAPTMQPGSRTAAAVSALGTPATPAAIGELFADFLTAWADQEGRSPRGVSPLRIDVDMPDAHAGAALAGAVLEWIQTHR
ncbi:2-phospho-L-lactate transferase CofD family protein [Gephyromycinifex aptenodytis]|uniref:2-phospho-L-lactate transferase CofD family protein n=1 Tax=Gephyromycinifex aptenodytis TaxID=2716227 RepID=UPI001444FD2E|nr:2-phospho-L-lactate transferase CofD family protein [Gephyromycinifex aptenodytis]